MLFEAAVYAAVPEICGGKVLVVSADGQELDLLVMQNSDSGRHWLPGWYKASRKPKFQQKKPVGFAPYRYLLQRSEVLLVGELRETNYVTEDTYLRMQAQHFV